MIKNKAFTKSYKSIIAATLLASALSPVQALAVTLSQAEADQLKTDITSIIEQHRLNYKLQGSTLVTEGDVRVKQNEKFYAVTLPHISIEDDNYNVTEIGIISMNVVPSSNREQWKASFAVPTPINVFKNGNELSTQLSIGGQRASVIWDKALANVIKADLQYQTVKLRNLDPASEINVPKVEYKVDLKQNANNTWSGPAQLNLFNITGSGEDNFGLDIETVKITGTTEELSPVAVRSFEETNAALGESLELNNDVNNVSPSHFKAYSNMLIDYYSSAANGFDLKMVADNIRMKGSNIETDNANLMIRNFEMSTTLKDLKSDKMSLDTNVQAKGIKAQPTPSTLPVLFPSNVGFNITVHDFPYQKALATAKEDLRNNPDSTAQSYVSGSLLNEKLPQMVDEAGTTISIQNTLLSNDNFKFIFDGLLDPDTTAAQKMTGNIKATVYNHDKLMQTFLMNAASNPFLMLPLSFQSMALKTVDAQGTPVHVYDLKVDKAGNLTVNNKPVGSSGGMFGGQ